MKPNAAQFALFDAVTDDTPEPALAIAVIEPPPDRQTARRKPRSQEPPPLLTPPPITGTPEAQSFIEFYQEHDRVPMIQDERKPWTYRGWLMWYRLLVEDRRPDVVPPRWSYWFATMTAGKLLDEPIPRIEFDGAGEQDNSPGCKHVAQLVDLCARQLADFSRIAPLLEWLLFAFGLSADLPNFPPALHEALYRTFNLEPFLTHPCDYFGAWIGANKGRWNPSGFYATPHNIVEMMTRMLFEDAGDCRAQTVNEPALGTGRMLLHASNYSLRLYGQDIDRTVLLAAQINGALYAPWLVRPFPEEFFK